MLPLSRADTEAIRSLPLDAEMRGSDGGSPLYAVVDAARSPMVIPPMIEAMASRYECLFRGNSRDAIADQAPCFEGATEMIKELMEQLAERQLAEFSPSTADDALRQNRDIYDNQPQLRALHQHTGDLGIEENGWYRTQVPMKEDICELTYIDTIDGILHKTKTIVDSGRIPANLLAIGGGGGQAYILIDRQVPNSPLFHWWLSYDPWGSEDNAGGFGELGVDLFAFLGNLKRYVDI